MPFADRAGIRIYWRSDGHEGAPPLLLSNSLGTDCAFWDPVMPRLAEYFNVVRMDTRGHGAQVAQWDDGGAGGEFGPSARHADPTYTAPENRTGKPLRIVLTATTRCDGPESLGASGSARLTVRTEPRPRPGRRAAGKQG